MSRVPKQLVIAPVAPALQRARHWLPSLLVLLACLATGLWGVPAAAAAGTPTEQGRQRLQRPSEAGPHGDTSGAHLDVYVITYGPGDHVFTKFGHNAIWIHDRLQKRDRVYNFGTFRFDSPSLIADFLKGRLRYWLSVSRLRAAVVPYERDNRSVVAQKLELTAEQKAELSQALAINALPQNRYYKYDYYTDNCSTRVRDALDQVLDGALRRQTEDEPGRLTWRAHTLRLTAESLPYLVGLHAALGDRVDQPISVWQEMFLPEVVATALTKVRVAGRDGKPRPLVSESRVLYSSTRALPPKDPPPRWPAFLLVGLGIAAFFVGLMRLVEHEPSRWRRAVYYFFTGIWASLLGLLGSIFCFFWFATDHQIAHHNENILLCAPWALVLLPLGVLAVFRPLPRRLFFLAAAGALVAATAGLALKVLPSFDQVNLDLIALVLPTWLALAGSARRVAGTIAHASETTASDDDSEITSAGEPSRAASNGIVTPEARSAPVESPRPEERQSTPPGSMPPAR